MRCPQNYIPTRLPERRINEMVVRAKFVCNYKQDLPPIEGETEGGARVTFGAVAPSFDDEGNNIVEENRVFGKWTPSASLDMTINNPTAAKQFEKGQSYYVDFTPASEGLDS